jgi:hypothetical protein
LQQQLQQLWPFHEAIVEDEIVKIIPGSIPVIPNPQLTNFPLPAPTTEEELFDKLEADSEEQKQRALIFWLGHYLEETS